MSSEYIDGCRHNYSMYVLKNRAFQTISDGLAAGSRRLLWTARDGKKRKSAALAGETMCLHPHAENTDTINTLAKVYGTNIPLLTGSGSFGTRLKTDACGAPRYTSVEASAFTKDVLYRDIEIVPMIDNYDGTMEEPAHFLPLVPIVLVNPTEGIGIGFSSDILPRALKDIVGDQIKHLQGKKIVEPGITFSPHQATSTARSVAKNGKTRWHFEGTFKVVDPTTVKITNIPYGTTHKDLTEKTLIALIESDRIVDFTDNSVDTIDIDVKFKRGQLSKFKNRTELLETLGLAGSVIENINIVNFAGDRLIVEPTYTDIIQMFTDWRLTWYVPRFNRLKDLVLRDIQRYLDVLLAIKKDAGGVAKKTANRQAFLTWLASIGVVDVDYVASLPVYRFTQAEADIVEGKLAEARKTLAEYDEYLTSEPKRTELFITELKEVLKKHG